MEDKKKKVTRAAGKPGKPAAEVQAAQRKIHLVMNTGGKPPTNKGKE